MNAIETNLNNIDELWAIHEHRDPATKIDGHCLAFAVDGRWLKADWDPDTKLRMGVSFGHNPFTPEMKTGFVPPPVRPGEFVFGLHLVATHARQLTLYDMWYDAREAGDCRDAALAFDRAAQILAAIPDDEYLLMVSEKKCDGPLSGVDDATFGQLEVVRGEAF